MAVFAHIFLVRSCCSGVPIGAMGSIICLVDSNVCSGVAGFFSLHLLQGVFWPCQAKEEEQHLLYKTPNHRAHSKKRPWWSRRGYVA